LNGTALVCEFERGGTSKLGLDVCRVTKRSLLVKASRLSYF
jgi:hypothetical protein